MPDEPVFNPLTEDEFSKIPITALGKILKYQTDTKSAWEIAGMAIQGYRGYIQSLFDKDAKAAAPTEEVPAAPAKKGWQFWK